eukprot:c15561_g1_i1.p1 GENE.c15561_g1_i1~~c15561_g1_i1.p1  ORF type:complete len:434 (-),score=169.19 c15561_g1_i1:21-1280(-)
MDLESYIGNYSGTTRAKRLCFIGLHSPEHRNEALKMLFDELKKGKNTIFYRECWTLFYEDNPIDEKTNAWLTEKEAANKSDLIKLETELNNYQVNLIKESIRMGFEELGDFQMAIGDVRKAQKSYIQAKDNCTTPKHITDACLRVVHSCIEVNDYATAAIYVGKAEASYDCSKDSVLSSCLKAATGLGFLHTEKFSIAASKFLDCSIELGTSFNHIISCQDIAVYGTLCAMASFDRAELKAKVINNNKFSSFLELVPELKEILSSFCESRYTKCLQELQKLLPTFLLDIHLRPFVNGMLKSIRNKALIQYCLPFTSVGLTKMAEVFSCSVEELEKDLCSLIVSGSIHARIDSQNKVLQARQKKHRDIGYEKVTQLGSKYEQDTIAFLIRANCIRHQYMIKKSSQSDTHQAGNDVMPMST